MRWGLQAWNRPDAGYGVEWDRVEAMKSTCMVIRSYHPTTLVDLALALNPDMTFILRWGDDGPIDVAKRLSDAQNLLWHLLHRGKRVIYSLDNEPNHLASPYKEAGPAGYMQDLADLTRAMREAYPMVPLCSPPMGVMQDDTVWAAAIEPVMRAFKVEYRGCHIYWQGTNWCSDDWGRRIAKYDPMWGNVPRIVDEMGDSTEGRNARDKAVATAYVMDYLARRKDVEAACVFIAGGTDMWKGFWLPPGELAGIGGALERLHGGGKVVTVGEGFQKAVPFSGQFTEDEIYHGGEQDKTSLAIAEAGYASWRKATNQTVVVCDDGRILADRGNHGNGDLVQVAGPF